MALPPPDFAADAAPALPASFRLRCIPHACPPATGSGLPDEYGVDAGLADLDLGDLGEAADADAAGGGPLGLRDTISAIYRADGGGEPANAAKLEDLLRRLAADWCLAALARFEVEYWGMVAVPPDGTVDAIEFRYDAAGGARTRVRSAPANAAPADYNHADPDDCPAGVALYSARPAAAVAGGKLALRKVRVRVERRGRRFRVKDLGVDSITLCPSSAATASSTATSYGGGPAPADPAVGGG